MDALILTGVKTHNLKNLHLTLPHNRFYVITGVSGSGKSSLAFDTLYAEGQRRYVESLSAYARQFLERMERPDVESMSGIRPAVAIQAKNVITNARSTVGTQTEINDYLRVLYARIGKTFCPRCSAEVTSSRPAAVADLLTQQHPGCESRILFDVPMTKRSKSYLREALDELERQGFLDFESEGRLLTKEERLKSSLKSDTISVCTDRVRFSASSRKRGIDSVELAFRYGRGAIRVQVLSEDKQPFKVYSFSEDFRCSSCGDLFRRPAPHMFSFNSPLGACPACQGFGREITLDWDLVIPDPRKSIQQGVIDPWSKPSAAWELKQLLKFCKKKKISLTTPWKDLSEAHKQLILHGGPEAQEEDFFSVQDFFDYLERKTYKMHVRIFLSKYRNFIPCRSCKESRLKPEAHHVKLRGKNIFELQSLSLKNLKAFLEDLKLSKEEMERVEPVFLEIQRRLGFLLEVGLGYLSLARLSRTLSGGEVQRIHLATSLGSALVDTLYVLDEPSIGLHERDNDLLIRLLKKLRDLGNTVVVVEHDRTMIESADEILDMGPQGGEDGGQVLFQGSVKGLSKIAESWTGQYLSGRLNIERSGKGPQNLLPLKSQLCIRGAQEHNLQNIDVEIPLGKFVVITGVSGSGKSSLIYDVLYQHYLKFKGLPVQGMGRARKVEGFEYIDEAVLIDQSPIGRSSRSNPATYLKAYDEIRKFFSRLPESRHRGFEAGHFSFNVDGGRCPVCEGEGTVNVEMHFLADMAVPCEECRGKRFKPEVLSVRYQGKNIDDVLGMTIDEVCRFFSSEPRVVQRLTVLQKIGLGYLKLGQSAVTLSGGEAQRLKLAYEMTERASARILYLFDEPTTGLHYRDIHYLIKAFDEMVARGHSLVVIEHNMELIRLADHVIDLGPEGGDEGGRVMYAGPLKGILNQANSYTGACLRQYLKRLN